MLGIENLFLYYENVTAVNNMSLKCGEGQIVGIFGTNSAGKSSLMYAISGLIIHIKKNEDMRGGQRITLLGKIIFQGQDVTYLRPDERAKKGIVLCPERRRIFPESSVLENLKIGGYLATRSQAETTLDYVFTIFPVLAKMQKREGGFLSGGEQQMLAIGRSLMAQPRLLLLDEPLLGLSPAIQFSLAKIIRQIREQSGLSILVAEQYARPFIPIVDYGYIIEKIKEHYENLTSELNDFQDFTIPEVKLQSTKIDLANPNTKENFNYLHQIFLQIPNATPLSVEDFEKLFTIKKDNDYDELDHGIVSALSFIKFLDEAKEEYERALNCDPFNEVLKKDVEKLRKIVSNSNNN